MINKLGKATGSLIAGLLSKIASSWPNRSLRTQSISSSLMCILDGGGMAESSSQPERFFNQFQDRRIDKDPEDELTFQSDAPFEEIVETLNCLPLGVILVNDQAEIVFVNRSGQDILSAPVGLKSTNGRLVADNAAETAHIGQFLQDIASARQKIPWKDVHRAMPISRENKRPLSAIFAPLQHPVSQSNNSRNLIGIFVTDSDRNHDAPEDILKRLYGLTLTESKLALALLHGQGLQQAARQTDMKINTARTHLKHLFGKTGTKRQAELVRLLIKCTAVIRFD